MVAHHLGTQAEIWCWTIHDLLFADFDISFETTNYLLYQQLILTAKYSKWRAGLVKWGVDTRWARKSFGNNTPEEEQNKKLINLQWIDDNRGFMIAQAIDFGNDPSKLTTLADSSVEYRSNWETA